ncbi:MAG: hypothetical protein RIF34_07380, partial [Candidatus Kapaibacterium sp.]
MATIFAVLPKVIAKLLTIKWYGLAVMAILLSAGLLVFIYVGQREVSIQKAADPLKMLVQGNEEIDTESQVHVIVTSLIGLLFSISTLLSYLYYMSNKDFKPMNFKLLMSKLWRVLQYKLLIVRGRFE